MLRVCLVQRKVCRGVLQASVGAWGLDRETASGGQPWGLPEEVTVELRLGGPRRAESSSRRVYAEGQRWGKFHASEEGKGGYTGPG